MRALAVVCAALAGGCFYDYTRFDRSDGGHDAIVTGHGGSGGGSGAPGGRGGASGNTGAGAGGRGGGIAGSTGGSTSTGRGGAGGGATGGTGTTGNAGSTGSGGACAIGSGAVNAGPCNATFNFEGDVDGATINTGSSAFQTIARSATARYCGSGALAITSSFSGTSGPTTKGEVLIPLPGAPVDLTGKKITVHVASDPGCSDDLSLALALNTESGAILFTPTFPIRPLTAAWKSATATVPTGSGTNAALSLSVQAFSSTAYRGTIYVDEIDIAAP